VTGEVTPPHAVRHYTVREIAKIWNLSPDTIVKIFEGKPGVMIISDRRKGSISRRQYRTLRIPEFMVGDSPGLAWGRDRSSLGAAIRTGQGAHGKLIANQDGITSSRSEFSKF